MANVTPTTPVRDFLSSSFNVPANFTRRGTGKAGTNSRGVCTVRLGACGSALTGCCACIPAAPQPRENNKPTPTHLMVQFMGSPLSSATEETQIFSRVKPRRASNEWGRSKEAEKRLRRLRATLRSPFVNVKTTDSRAFSSLTAPQRKRLVRTLGELVPEVQDAFA